MPRKWNSEGSIVHPETNGLKLNEFEQRKGLSKAIRLYEQNISRNSDEDNAFERLAVIYRSRNKVEDEIRVSKKAVAFYEHVVFDQHLESRLPLLNQFTKRLRAATSILASQRNH